MKRILILLVYWIAAIFMIAFLLVSLDYPFWQGLMIGMIFLPCSMALSFFLPKVAKEPAKDRLKHYIYIVLGVMAFTLLLLIIIHLVFSRIEEEFYYDSLSFAPILSNPVFIAIILTILAYGEFLLRKKLNRKSRAHNISFTSDYKKVIVNTQTITYVESRDSEVWVFTCDGESYRNKTGISQWENLLGDGFLHIHRSYLVNISQAVQTSSDSVSVGNVQLPVSRKYKEAVQEVLGQQRS